MYSVQHFPSVGKIISVETIQPKHGIYPAILFVHGSGGLLTRQGAVNIIPNEENFGEYQVSCRGYAVVMVHYFDANGIANAEDLEFIHQNSRTWLDVLRQAISVVRTLSGIDKRAKIGIIGESLGAYLSLALGSEDARIGAISEISGGIPDQWFDHPERLPPVLIQHGEQDSVVPVDEARKLENLLKAKHVQYEIHIYEGLRHVFPSAERKQALEISVQFFDRHLKLRNAIRSQPCSSNSAHLC